jgi:hypothetical protein
VGVNWAFNIRSVPISSILRDRVSWATRASQRALPIALRTSEAARIHHSDMAQRKVIANGILRIDRTKRRRDFRRHLPSGTHVSREPQAATEPDDVRIEWNDEP